MKKLLLNFGFLVLVSIIISACSSREIRSKENYFQLAPTKHPKTDNVILLEYSNRHIKLDGIRTMFFDDYLVLGRSEFSGGYEKNENIISFAKSIGADIVIINTQWMKTGTSLNPTAGSGNKVSTYAIYNHDNIFLKNINNITPLWEKTINDYQKTTNNILEGVWENGNYKVNVFQSENQIVAFINEIKASDVEKELLNKNSLKFSIDIKSNKGVYLRGDKTPLPSNFKINKFGFLEIILETLNKKVSFKKVQ